jgi:hypothetical protein
MSRPWSNSIATVLGALVSLLPTATCPACLGAYAGLVSAMGVGFLFTKQVLLPLIGVFLLLGIAGAIMSRRRHHRSGPLLLTIGGSLSVALGRIIWDVPVLVYAGALALALASVWNFWLRRIPARNELVQLSTQ